MKLKQITTAVALLCCSAWASAGVLNADNGVEILAFDGHKVKRNAVLQINEGQQHQVVVSVGGIVNDSYFDLEPMVLRFNGSAENVQISTPMFNTKSDVNRFKAKPVFHLKTASGKNLAHQQDYLQGEGLFPNAKIEENLAKYNRKQAPASVAKFADVAMVATAMTISQANSGMSSPHLVVQTNNVSEEDLQYLFKKADKATQKRFLEWAKKQK